MSLNVSLQSEKRWEPESLIGVAWQRKWLVLLGCVLGLAGGAALAVLLPRTYQSNAQISIVKKSPDTITGIDTRQLAAEESTSPPQDIMRSTMIIKRAIQAKGLGSIVSIGRNAEETDSIKKDEDLTDSIKNALTIAATRNSNGVGSSSVLRISFRAGSPEDSRAVLDPCLRASRDTWTRNIKP